MSNDSAPAQYGREGDHGCTPLIRPETRQGQTMCKMRMPSVFAGAAFLEETMTKKLKKPKPLSWKAIRRGDTFCAPACGHGCTYQEYERAKISAKTLCENLGPGWKPNVWENMGWHFQAVSSCGRLKVHTDGLLSRSFRAYLGEAGSSGGRWAERGSTPKAAVASVKSKARSELAYIASLLHGLPGGNNGLPGGKR